MKMERDIQYSKFSTMVDILRIRAVLQAEKSAFTYLVDGEKQELNLTYEELDLQARSIAAILQSTIEQGQCALLLYPPGLELITAFLGCLYAGVVAIPAYPPRHSRNLSRHTAIATNAEATVVLTTRSVMANMARLFNQNSTLMLWQLLPTDNLSTEPAQQWRKPTIESDSLAFLQYTSGSTGNPKGVMVSHGNLLHNQRMIKDFFGHTDKSIGVGWLPSFHDMGLIGNILQPLYLGSSFILMSPAAVLAGEARVAKAIEPYGGEVIMSAINGPNNVVISGRRRAVEAVTEHLGVEKIKSKPLEVSCAFHSPLMEPMSAEFEKIARQVNYTTPQIGIVSNLTGVFIKEEMATPEYWVRHIRQPMRLADGVRTLEQTGYAAFVELGPNPVLLQMARQSLSSKGTLLLAGLRKGRSDWKQLLSSLAELYVRGLSVDWQGFDREYPRRKVVLPTYPFQRRRYWIDKEKSSKVRSAVPSEGETNAIASMLNKGETEQLMQVVTNEEDLSEDEKNLLPKILKALVRQYEWHRTMASVKKWLYEVQWTTRKRKEQRTGQGEGDGKATGAWLIFADRSGVGQCLAALLEERGHRCVLVYHDDGYNKEENNRYTVNPVDLSDFERLIQEIKASGLHLMRVVHLWSLDAPAMETLTVSALEKSQLTGCGSVLHTVQALARSYDAPSFRLWLVTRGTVAAGEKHPSINVCQSPLWGLGKVISLEHPDIWGGLVDLSIEAPTEEAPSDEAARLTEEIQDPQGEDQIAFCADERRVARLTRSKPVQPQKVALQPDGTYLITGGLGALGLKVAKWLVKKGGRHLVLLGRPGPSDAAKEIIDQLAQTGADILTVKADVSNKKQMAEVFESIAASGYALRGIIHSAGVMEDGILLKQTWESFKRVMRSKVIGTWNLHVLTRNLPLDFFVCFSSIASLLGSPGRQIMPPPMRLWMPWSIIAVIRGFRA